jgi:heptosyltransferase II
MTRSSEFTSILEIEAAARGALTKISRRKLLLIRALEIILLPVVCVTNWLRSQEFSGQQGPIRKILVVEYWQMGDAILLLPFLQNLRRHYPQSTIVWLGNPRVLPLLKSQAIIDKSIPVRVPWAQHFSRWRKYNPFSLLWLELARTVLLLRRERFDLALSGRMDIRDNLLLWLTGARRRVGFGVGGGGFLLTDIATPDLKHPHRSYAWMRLLEHIGSPVLETRVRLKLCKEQEDTAERFVASHGISNDEIVVGFHSGVRIATRQWGIPNFLAVMEQLLLNFSIRVLWFEEPSESTERPGPGESVARVSLPLDSFLAVLARCDLLICNDSGPMHMAEALGVPVVAIFGPTQPAWFGPTDEGSRVVYRPEFWCRPCFDYCVFDQPYCLRTVSVESVFEAASKVVQSISHQKLLLS